MSKQTSKLSKERKFSKNQQGIRLSWPKDPSIISEVFEIKTSGKLPSHFDLETNQDFLRSHEIPRRYVKANEH